MLKSICKIGSSLHSVLEAISHEPIGIAFVVNVKGQLSGVLTDGDVRRLLLDGMAIDSVIEPQHLSDCISAPLGTPHSQLLKLSNQKVRIIPLLDDNGVPVDFFRYEHKTNFIPVAQPDLKGNELKYLTDAFLSTWISSRGEYIDRFESDFSNFCGVNHSITVANGTVALHLALKALGLGAGDEVIVPDLTFAATINAVIHAGATPVIVDVEEATWTICPNKIQEAITANTKVIIPVHVYGQPCDMERIMSIANEHQLYVIEDAAEAHGAEFNGRKVGSFGHISTFSFFANKIITTGEGGMCVTNDVALAEKMRTLRDHGMNASKRYWHDEVGFNYRMTNLQAAIGCAQLEKIEDILAERQNIEHKYKSILEHENVLWQKEIEGRKKTVWLVSILSDSRDSLADKLRQKGIDTRPFFFPLSAMDIYKPYCSKPCPVSSSLSVRGLNLPTYIGLGEVPDALKQAFQEA